MDDETTEENTVEERDKKMGEETKENITTGKNEGNEQNKQTTNNIRVKIEKITDDTEVDTEISKDCSIIENITEVLEIEKEASKDSSMTEKITEDIEKEKETKKFNLKMLVDIVRSQQRKIKTLENRIEEMEAKKREENAEWKEEVGKLWETLKELRSKFNKESKGETKKVIDNELQEEEEEDEAEGDTDIRNELKGRMDEGGLDRTLEVWMEWKDWIGKGTNQKKMEDFMYGCLGVTEKIKRLRLIRKEQKWIGFQVEMFTEKGVKEALQNRKRIGRVITVRMYSLKNNKRKTLSRRKRPRKEEDDSEMEVEFDELLD